MTAKLANKIALVTGRRQAELDAAVKAIGHDAIGLRVDSSDVAALDSLYDEIRARYGRLDVLYANAGGGSMPPLGEITEEQFDYTFDRNGKARCSPCRKRCRCCRRAPR